MNYNLKPFKHSSHYKILDLIEKNKKILDVACAGGYMASLLKEKGCSVVGVDFDAEYINEAKKHCEAYFLDITKEKVEGKYDVIILGDILEHLPAPNKILLDLKENLNENGYIIISLPNIVNIYPRLKILFGSFDYQDKGIFDRTHLRFFTRKTLKEMLVDTGYTIEKMEYTPIPFHVAFPGVPKFIVDVFYYISYLGTIIWPTLFAYQFVVKIRCKK
jgi:2-polyprenyl-3-methyl-5-hydroxy-6-metoxy-1,4-benzoquinol methylase